MGRLYNFLLGMVVGFALYHATFNYHVVYAADGVHLVAKQPPRFDEMYVNIQNFTWEDWQQHPQLALALKMAGKENLIIEQAGNFLEQAIDNGLNKVLPPAQP